MDCLYRFKKFLVNWLKRDKKIIIVSLCGGMFVTVFAGAMATKTYSDTIQSGIADSVVRFHVLANSDEDFDQSLKLKVRDAVLLEMNDELSASNDVEETKKILNASKEYIRQVALGVIREEGYNYDVHVSMSRDLFPTKVYGDIAFPTGMYDALRIEIGNADGQNWWCVMFPPLCFVDVSYEEVSKESKEELKNILTEDEYEIVVSSKAKESITPEIKFKIVEWWQEKENKGTNYATKK